jgi:ABC-type glycerol-3-phosphate transport system permease component
MVAIAGARTRSTRRGPVRFLRRWAFGLLVTGIAVWSLFPFVWQVVTSFEPDRDTTATSSWRRTSRLTSSIA